MILASTSLEVLSDSTMSVISLRILGLLLVAMLPEVHCLFGAEIVCSKQLALRII